MKPAVNHFRFSGKCQQLILTRSFEVIEKKKTSLKKYINQFTFCAWQTIKKNNTIFPQKLFYFLKMITGDIIGNWLEKLNFLS
jgi:hypothetical protein